MLKFGEQQFPTRKPKDLDASLLAATGLCAAEIANQLRGNPLAHLVAEAARPFLDDSAPPAQALATAIAAHGVTEAAAQVLKLYADPKAGGGEA